MWGSIALGALAILLILILARSGDNQTSSKAAESTKLEMDQVDPSTVAKAEAKSPAKPLKPASWEERERERAARVERLIQELRREISPQDLRSLPSWLSFERLVREAETLIGISRGDSRERVDAPPEKLSEAKAKAMEARQILDSDPKLHRLSTYYSEAVIEVPGFEFYLDWTNRNSALLLKLKGVH